MCLAPSKEIKGTAKETNNNSTTGRKRRPARLIPRKLILYNTYLIRSL